MAILNLYEPFWCKKTGKNLDSQKWAFQIYLNLLVQKDWKKKLELLFKPVMVCNGLKSNEICTFLDFKKFFEKNIL